MFLTKRANAKFLFFAGLVIFIIGISYKILEKEIIQHSLFDIDYFSLLMSISSFIVAPELYFIAEDWRIKFNEANFRLQSYWIMSLLVGVLLLFSFSLQFY